MTWHGGGRWTEDPQARVFVYPGLFWYSGFGMGNYFSAAGKVYWHSSSEAANHARGEGVKFDWVDSMKHYVPVALGDR